MVKFLDWFKITELLGTQENHVGKDIKRIACEFNIKPENPISKSFHLGLGYKRVGTQLTELGTKEVSLMIKEIND